MSSKSQRRGKGSKGRRQSTPQVADPHVQVVMDSLGGMYEVMTDLMSQSDPAQAVEARLTAIIDDITAKFCTVDPPRIIEVARLACLPWSWVPAGADGGPPRAELLALLAVTATRAPAESDAVPECESAQAQPDETEGAREKTTAAGANRDQDPQSAAVRTSGPQPLTDMVNESLPHIDRLLQLAQARQILTTESIDAIGMIAVKMRAAEVWTRNTSYPDRVAITLHQLFDGSQVTATLHSDLGFDADQALQVLDSCHALQVAQLNDRVRQMRTSLDEARLAIRPSNPDPTLLALARKAWTTFWDGETAAVTVTVAAIGADTGLDETVVEAVLRYFTLDIDDWSPRQAVEEFISGNNPLRTHPVIRTPDGRAMLVHNAQVLNAIRENLEQHLKTTSAWDKYQKARGDLLETRTHAAFARVFPDANTWNGFEYFVPNSEAEEQGEPSGYTKRVEGDHLIVEDDVAIIVEDKAVAVSPRSRAGETRRLRGDLTSIVKKASEQAGRLQDRIQRDGGVRLNDSGWLDLSHVREIHTAAVSLDDLPGASTTTAELVQAGFIDANHIPWTVSLHDLDIITQLVDLPAEFLLYLRRRRDPLATVMYTAPDELDLFLYFFESGLYVEPDPDKVRELLPHMPAPTTAERRRFRRQTPVYLTSRTDSLDAWHYSSLGAQGAETGTTNDLDVGDEPGSTADRPEIAPKPRMVTSPLEELIVAVQERGDYAWLSIGATLLSGATPFQAKAARIPASLLANPLGDGRGRSLTIPMASNREDGWLLVWLTRPTVSDPHEFDQQSRDYLRAKKHQQTLPRGVAFVYDEGTDGLVDVIYDGYQGELEPRVQERLALLKPANHFENPPHPDGKRRPGSSARGRSKGSKKRRR